jgi:hypothetical protein
MQLWSHLSELKEVVTIVKVMTDIVIREKTINFRIDKFNTLFIKKEELFLLAYFLSKMVCG